MNQFVHLNEIIMSEQDRKLDGRRLNISKKYDQLKQSLLCLTSSPNSAIRKNPLSTKVSIESSDSHKFIAFDTEGKDFSPIKPSRSVYPTTLISPFFSKCSSLENLSVKKIKNSLLKLSNKTQKLPENEDKGCKDISTESRTLSTTPKRMNLEASTRKIENFILKIVIQKRKNSRVFLEKKELLKNAESDPQTPKDYINELKRELKFILLNQTASFDDFFNFPAESLTSEEQSDSLVIPPLEINLLKKLNLKQRCETIVEEASVQLSDCFSHRSTSFFMSPTRSLIKKDLANSEQVSRNSSQLKILSAEKVLPNMTDTSVENFPKQPKFIPNLSKFSLKSLSFQPKVFLSFDGKNFPPIKPRAQPIKALTTLHSERSISSLQKSIYILPQHSKSANEKKMKILPKKTEKTTLSTLKDNKSSFSAIIRSEKSTETSKGKRLHKIDYLSTQPSPSIRTKPKEFSSSPQKLKKTLFNRNSFDHIISSLSMFNKSKISHKKINI